MNIEENRLETFRNWPANVVVSPRRLAKAGFYSTNNGLEVKCFLCNVRIPEWSCVEQVLASHKSISPQCLLVLNPSASVNVALTQPDLISTPLVSVASTSNAYLEESERLASFDNWPVPHIVTPQSLAAAGFYYLNHGDTTRCAYCKGTVRYWLPEDHPDREHKKHFPGCSFVISVIAPRLAASEISSEAASGGTSSQFYQDEEQRLLSFENWPLLLRNMQPTVESLVKAGFYYTQEEPSSTKCAFCDGSINHWDYMDDPDRKHKHLFPGCPFVISEITPRLLSRLSRDNSSTNLELLSNDNLDELGVNTHKPAKHPDAATLEARLRTFGAWPMNLVQTPEQLANSGFYYEGTGDQVRCFHCDGGLRDWDPQDDPWTEHARWFPLCSFVKIVKGQDFIIACKVECNVNNKANPNAQVENKPEIRKTKRRIVSDREVEQHLTSDIALAALNIGLNLDRVKKAIKERLEQTGQLFSQPDALVEAALSIQCEEAEDTEPEVDSDEFEMVPAPRRPTFRPNLSNTYHMEVLCSTSTSGKNDQENDTSSMDDDMGSKKSDKTNDGKPITLEEENRLLKEARLCKICMDVEVGVVFLPCGHFATCVHCAPNLQDCPVCRSSIKATVRTFLS